MNEYLKDALLFTRRAAKIIDYPLEDNQMVEATLHFALGIERILKGILWDINPIYILSDPSFKNSAPILYYEKLLVKGKNQEIADKPSGDVLTFRTSLLRAMAFSKTTRQYSGLLFALSEYRDIIVHRPLVELNSKKLEKLLMFDFITVIKDYARELEISLDELVGDDLGKLEMWAPDYALDIKERMQEKIAFYKSEWESIKKNHLKMKALEPLFKKYASGWYMEYLKCPACDNTAVMTIEPDYDVQDGEAVLAGIFPTSMHCSFCGFSASDYEEVDYLRLSDALDRNLSHMDD